MRKLILLAIVGVAVIGIGCAAGWQRSDSCGPDDICTPCDTDEDCMVSYDCCGPSVICWHVDEDKGNVCARACVEPVPPPCTCIDGQCQFP